MNAKHLTKNVMSYKFVLLVIGLILGILAVFSVSLVKQADALIASSDRELPNWKLTGTEGTYKELYFDGITGK